MYSGSDGERSEPGDLLYFLGPRAVSTSAPQPLTPPPHSLREWGEKNREACGYPTKEVRRAYVLVRMRIMKASNGSSAICHHRYASLR